MLTPGTFVFPGHSFYEDIVMSSDFESIVRAENKSRVKWGFIWAIICAILWGLGYVALSMLWLVPPYKEFAIFPKGSDGFIVATISMVSSASIIYSLILTIFWVGGTGKMSDLPRTIRFFKASRWYMLAAVFGGPVAIFGSTLAIGYIGGAFAASAALLSAVVGAVAAKIWYGENISRKAWMGICLILLGGIFIWNPGQMIAEITNPLAPEGIWIGYLGSLMSVIGWGLEGATAARALDVTDADTGILTRFISESFIWIFIFWPASMIIFGFDTVFNAIIATLSSPSFIIWALIAGLTVGLCYVALYKAYPLIGVGRGLSVGSLYVIFAILGLSFFMGSPIGLWLVIGASIAIIGTFVMYWESGDSLLECTRDCKPALAKLKEGIQ